MPKLPPSIPKTTNGKTSRIMEALRSDPEIERCFDTWKGAPTWTQAKDRPTRPSKPAPEQPKPIDPFAVLRATAATLLKPAPGLDPLVQSLQTLMGRALLNQANEIEFQEVIGQYLETSGGILAAEMDERFQEGITLGSFAELVKEQQRWLWPQRFPENSLSLICGEPEVGKTWVALDLIARLTTGRAFCDGTRPTLYELLSGPSPDPNDEYPGDGYLVPGDGGTALPFRFQALWVGQEDGKEVTILPRLEMLGADTTRVKYVKGIVHDGKRQSLNLQTHLDKLKKTIRDNPCIRVIVLDPITDFLGGIGKKSHDEIQTILGTITDFCIKYQVSIIGIIHLTKGDSTNAMHRIQGSMALIAKARAAWMLAKDPGDKNLRHFAKVKANLATEEVGGLLCSIGPAVPAGILWREGTAAISGDDALKALNPYPPSGHRPAPAVQEAKDWLLELFKESEDGKVLASDLWSKAEAEHLCERTVRKAAKELGITAKRTGGPNSPYVWIQPRAK